MKANFFKKLAMGIAMLCTPIFSQAWGLEGHRICGQIADSYLTPKARAAIQAILGNESIAMASNWADFIKSDDNYKYLSSWHYIDFDKAYTYPEMQDFLAHDTNVDAYTKLTFMIGELKKKDISKENKLLYLRMVIHIVEDLHQPMHTGHTTDQGGNKVNISWFNDQTNLHSVWDSKLIDFQQLSYTEYVAVINHTTLTERTEWQKAPISQWLFESNQLAEKIYAETAKMEKFSPYNYNFMFLNTMNEQMLKGGVRLAGVLNQLFG
jgi:hypothetical protein